MKSIIQNKSNSAEHRGATDCYQDSCENAPFASIGGLDKRLCPTAPRYVPVADRESYLIGYARQALDMYGTDWATCAFGWQHALTIEATE